MLLRVCLRLWVEVSCPSFPYGAIRPFWYCLCAVYAQLMEDSGQLYGDMLAATDRGMLKVDELVFLYRLKESKEHGYYELVPWEQRTKIVKGLPSSFRYGSPGFSLWLGTILRLPLARFGVISRGCIVSGEPRP